jgi:hypothetical protein
LFTQAYNDKINSASVTGTTTKTLTLTQQDGGTITASWTDLNTDAVISVFGRTGAVVAANGDYTTAQVTESGNLYFTNARSRQAISLTTSGTSGAATYDNSTGVFNIPQYQSVITNPVTGTGSAGQVAYWSSSSAITGESNLFWDASNDRLGIGTATPATQLNVGHQNHGIGLAYLGASSFPPIAGIFTSEGTAGGQTGYGSLLIKARTDFAPFYSINFYTAATANVVEERMRITAAGRVLIGTPIPSESTFALDVNGTGRFSDSLTINGNIQLTTGANRLLRIGSSTAYYYDLQTVGDDFQIREAGTTPRLTFTYPTGNATFSSSLSANSGSLFNANSGTLTQDILTVRGGGSSGNFGFRVEANNGEDIFFVNNTSYNIIMSPIAGNVLIGTTDNAGFKLDVNGTGRFSGNLEVVKSSNPYLIINDSGVASTGGILFQPTGFNAKGGLTLNFATAEQRLFTGEGGNTYFQTFYTNGSERMRITAAGDLSFKGRSTTANYDAVFYNDNSQLAINANNTNVGKTINFNVRNDQNAMTIASGGSVTINNLSGSGNRIVVANSGGTLISAVIGSGLAFDGTTLTATGGGSGSISGSGTSGTIALFTGSTSIGNSVITQSGSTIGFTSGITDSAVTFTNSTAYSTSNNYSLTYRSTTASFGIQPIANIIFDTVGDAASQIRFVTRANAPDYATRMTINSVGNVGIGSTTPTQGRLVVSGGVSNSIASIAASFSGGSNAVNIGDDGTNAVIGAGNSGTNLVFLRRVAGVYSPAMTIVSNGRVLIGGAVSDNGSLFRILGPNGVGTFFDAQNEGAAGVTFARINASSVPFNQYTFANGNVIVGGIVTATSFFESSDATIKTLIDDNYQAKGIESVVAKLYIKNGKQELGYFAQDLENILPSAVNKGTDGLLNLSYREVHTAKIAALEKEIAELKKQLKNN